MEKIILFTLCFLTSLQVSCAQTAGGENSAGPNTQQNPYGNNPYANNPYTNNPNNPGGTYPGQNPNPFDPANPANPTGLDTVDPNAAAATDQEICSFMQSIPSMASRASRELNYLCNQGWLQKVKSSQASVQVVKEQGNGGMSEVIVAASAPSNGHLARSQQLASLYCRDFSSYRTLVAPAVYENVQNIATRNASGGNCEFSYFGKKILFFQPVYDGRIETHTNAKGNIIVNVNYLTQKKSLVEEAVTVLIIAKQANGSRVWNFTTSIADSKGFHNQVVSGLRDGTKLGISEYARILATN